MTKTNKKEVSPLCLLKC